MYCGWGWAFLSGNLYWGAGAAGCGAGVGIFTWMLVGSRLTSALNPCKTLNVLIFINTQQNGY